MSATTVTVSLNEADKELLDVVFPGGKLMASADDVIDDSINVFYDELLTLAHRRYLFAVSGAMRWPWSQEVWMTSRIRRKNGEFER